MDTLNLPLHASEAEADIRQQIAQHLAAAGVNVPGADLTLTDPPASDLGDFALPCFAFAKERKEPPAKLAARIAAQPLPAGSNALIAAATATGSYVNYTVNPATFGAAVLSEIARAGGNFGHAMLGAGKTVLVEYFSPNTNKPLTVGHLRNICLGFSLSHLLQAFGFRVVENSIYNDRGIALCKAIVAYQRWGEGKTPADAGVKPDHFAGQFYVRFNQAAAVDPALEEEAQACLQQWEAGDPSVRAIWRQLVDWTMDGFTQTLTRVGVDHPAVRYFESEIYTHGREIVEDGLARGIFQRHHEGYVYAPLEAHGLPDKILLRSDGTTLYITQDLYLARLKAEHQPALSIYVVASEQDLAFRQLFKILELLGESYPMVHRSYGMMRLPSGRIKSREGVPAGAGADELLTMLDTMAAQEVRTRHAGLGDAAVAKRAQAIAISALKYYILQVNAPSAMVFDPAKSLQFTGRTGPYLQYVHARCSSILRKAGSMERRDGPVSFAEPAERPLLVQLSHFPRKLREAAVSLDPSVLAQHLYDLAQAFSTFYQTVPVLAAPEPARRSRLQMVAAVKTVMGRGLALLGIPAVEEM